MYFSVGASKHCYLIIFFRLVQLTCQALLKFISLYEFKTYISTMQSINQKLLCRSK